MMCGGALMARPLSPLREALSATLTHLSGVLPPHLGYSPGTGKVQHDWLWSVGGSPFSFTSLGERATRRWGCCLSLSPPPCRGHSSLAVAHRARARAAQSCERHDHTLRGASC